MSANNLRRQYTVHMEPIPSAECLVIDIEANGPFLACGMAEAMKNNYRAVSVERDGYRVEIIGRCQRCNAFVTGDRRLRDQRRAVFCGECRK